MPFGIKAILIPKAAKLNKLAANMSKAIDRALSKTGTVALAALKKPTRTWNHKPVWVRVRLPGEYVVGTDDAPYMYVTRGTRVRYAIMTPGFLSKTMPGSLMSRRGAGGVAFISRKHPMPGIKARGFEQLAADAADKQSARIFNEEFSKVVV